MTLAVSPLEQDDPQHHRDNLTSPERELILVRPCEVLRTATFTIARLAPTLLGPVVSVSLTCQCFAPDLSKFRVFCDLQFFGRHGTRWRRWRS